MTALLILLATLGLALPGASPPPTSTPAAPATGPKELYRLTGFEGLAGLLNLARGCVRIVAFVSPTTAGVDADLDAVLATVRANSSKRLRAYVVITTSADADGPLQAAKFAGRHAAERVVYLWEPSGNVAGIWKSSVGAESAEVHSVYFLYDTAATFVGAPAAPDAWMLDRRDVKVARFDADAFGDRANELVRRVESKVTGAAPRTP